MTSDFYKYHALGNDYIVIDPNKSSLALTEDNIRLVCHRNFGVGSDGILYGPRLEDDMPSLRIFNPDGSEAEKSGNGLRIFARYLHATGKTKKTHFTVETKGGLVTIDLHLDRRGDASAVTVEMGRAAFTPASLPCTLPVQELIQQSIEAAGRSLTFTGVSVGNPHCVVFKKAGESWSREDLLALGPALEHHAIFPKRTNVQLAVPSGPKEVTILIWERGAGETQASGSSSCAAASAAVRLGLVTSPVAIKMPGGTLTIDVAPDFSLTMKGPVAEVARGSLSPSFVRSLQ